MSNSPVNPETSTPPFNKSLTRELEFLGLAIDTKVPEFYSEVAVGRHLIQTRGDYKLTIEELFDQFCKDVMDGTLYVPRRIKSAVKESINRSKALNNSTSKNIMNFYWEMFAYVLSIKVSIFSLNEDELLVSVYGDKENSTVNLVFLDGKYKILRYLGKPDKGPKNYKNKVSVLDFYDNKKQREAKPYYKSMIHTKLPESATIPKQPKEKINKKDIGVKAPNKNQDYNKSTSFKDLPYNKNKPLPKNSIKFSNVVDYPCHAKDYSNRSRKEFSNHCKNPNGMHDKQVGPPKTTKAKAQKPPKHKPKGKNPFNEKKVSPLTHTDEEKFMLNEALEFILHYQQKYQSYIKPYLDSRKESLDDITVNKALYKGRIKFYNEDTKFGFIVTDDNSEVLMHKDNVVRSKIYTKGLENCARFFDILVQFRVMNYSNGKITKTKACDIELVNFVPKVNLADLNN